jgi:glutathione S-transferase
VAGRRPIKLYRAPWSTNVERVALALAHKGLAVESELIDYSDRSPVERVSGQGLVPVIDDGGEVVADSRRILRYLEDRHPDPRLFPADPARRAEVDVFVDWFDEAWKLAPNAIEAELGRPEPDRGRIGALSRRMGAWLDRFELLLTRRDHLMGDGFSAADCVAFPFLKFARSRDPADDELFHRILDEHQPLGDHHPRLAAWIERVDARPRAY